MQTVFVIITKLIASENYFCKEVFCNNFGRDGSDKLTCPFLVHSPSSRLGHTVHRSPKCGASSSSVIASSIYVFVTLHMKGEHPFQSM